MSPESASIKTATATKALRRSTLTQELLMTLSLRSPCPVRPTLTTNGKTTSACAQCNKHVHHLTRMTEAEGNAILQRAKTEDTCVQYIADARGNVVFAPKLRQIAAAGLLVFAPAALADGGDVAAQAQAEMNRIQNEMNEVGIDPTNVVINNTAKTTNAQQDASKTDGTGPGLEPEIMEMWEGFI